MSDLLRASADEVRRLTDEIERLTAANAALMAERASLIETKREQIERLTAERDAALAKLAQYEQAPVVGYVNPDSLPRLNVHNGERGVTLLSSWPRDPGSIALISRLRELEAGGQGEPGTLQDRVAPWMQACFGPEISADKLERGDRFLEEAVELLQSVEYPRERIYALIEYVYGRDQGEVDQEVGGVMITLAAFCLAHGLDMHRAGETELARIWTKVEKIRAKHAAKPTGSALPIAVPASPSHAALQARVRELEEALEWYAEQARLCRLIHSEGDAGRHALSADGGKRARKALGGSNE